MPNGGWRAICSVMGISTLQDLREADGGGSGKDSFGDHAVHGSDDLREFFAAAEFDANTAVAGETARAGEDEVAKTGESGHGFGAASAGDDEAGHFGEAPGNEGRCGIVSEAQAVADAGGDGNDIFQRAAEFDADDIVIGVDAEAGDPKIPAGLCAGGWRLAMRW